jgi:hypothetical protein
MQATGFPNLAHSLTLLTHRANRLILPRRRGHRTGRSRRSGCRHPATACITHFCF